LEGRARRPRRAPPRVLGDLSLDANLLDLCSRSSRSSSRGSALIRECTAADAGLPREFRGAPLGTDRAAHLRRLGIDSTALDASRPASITNSNFGGARPLRTWTRGSTGSSLKSVACR
jgi:hypothetical protein